jgi:hypothetical protein
MWRRTRFIQQLKHPAGLLYPAALRHGRTRSASPTAGHEAGFAPETSAETPVKSG